MKILRNKKFLTVMAMVLMVAMVVGMGTMTYARYVTSKGMDAPESATVADWGYVLTIDTSNMFGKAYENGVVNEAFTEPDGGNDKIDVKAIVDASSDVIAPGTSGYMTITVSGNAEVLAQLSIATVGTVQDVQLVYSENSTVKTYNPVKWSLTKKVGTGTATDLAKNTTLNEALAALAAQGGKLAAGTAVQETVYTLSWAWALNESTAVNDSTNLMDTALGMKAANKSPEDIAAATGITLATDDGGKTTSTTMSVQISASIIQIQD